MFGRTFSVDETGVVYFARSDAEGMTSLRHLEFTTGETREMATLAVLPTLGLTVSRDGRTVLFAAQKPADDDLYLIDDFR
jgi:hypothetical protein